MLEWLGRDAWERIVSDSLLFLPRIVTSLVLLLAFWVMGAVAGKMIQRAGRLRRVNADVISIMSGSARVGLLAVGIMMALGTLGVDVTALVAGLGLTGFAVGFALKDVISNALAGVLILIYEPFRRNERIAVGAFEGRVSRITLRYTTLDTGDKEILIPNSNLFTNPIVVHRTPEPGPPGPADSRSSS